MEVRTCKGCKRLFSYTGGQTLCPKCSADLEVKFRDVTLYIIKNPLENVEQVAEGNGMTSSQIRQWFKEERIRFADECVTGVVCESCGVNIRTGRFCDECKNKLHDGFEKFIRSEEAADNKSDALKKRY